MRVFKLIVSKFLNSPTISDSEYGATGEIFALMEEEALALGNGTNTPSIMLTKNTEQTATNKTIDNAQNTLLNVPYLGTVQLYPAAVHVNCKFLPADGTAISRTTYSEYFALVGITFGPGNGTTTFNLPNIASPDAGHQYFVRALP
jgi:hypothetical protein